MIMKKGLKFLLAIPFLLLISGCNTKGDGKDHLVSFESNGGTQYKEVVVKSGEAVKLPEPTKDNNNFLGWYDNVDFQGKSFSGVYKPSSDVTFYAKWAEIVKTYRVHFEYEGVADMLVRVDNNVITLPKVEKYGSHFNGWRLVDKEGSEVYDGEFTVQSNLTFYPSFSDVHYLYLYLNECCDVIRLEYEPRSTVLISALPTPAPYIVNNVSYPFVKWVLQSGQDAPAEISLSKTPTILIAVYNH